MQQYDFNKEYIFSDDLEADFFLYFYEIQSKKKLFCKIILNPHPPPRKKERNICELLFGISTTEGFAFPSDLYFFFLGGEGRLS